jgi:hypothetical protein
MRLPDTVVMALSEFVPAANLQRMRVVRSAPWRWLPNLLGMSAITFAPFVFFKAGRFRTDTARGMALIAHEAVHIGQAGELGWKFYPKYLWGQLRCGFRHDKHPMEIPGIAVQREARRVLESRGGGGSW